MNKTETGQSSPPDMAGDAMSSFFAARSMTYEELRARQELEEKKLKLEAEEYLLYMTDPMRQMQVDRLIAVANCDKVGIPGMTPDMAIVTLQEVLDRPDFSFVDELYPGLREAVYLRYDKIVAQRLPGRKAK